MIKSFYDALNSTREYHHKFQCSVNITPNLNIDINVDFSGVEVYGKYLDLNRLFLQYCNLPNFPAKVQDYLQYLDRFNSFFHIPESSKLSKQYASYITELWNYLDSFLHRTQPLIELENFTIDWQSNFEQKWETGQVSGWKLKSSAPDASQAQPLRLGMFHDVLELEALGIDRLKEALVALGLKCGGSLKDRAQRLWEVRGVKPEDFPLKLLAKRKHSQETLCNGHGDSGDGAAYSDSRKQVSVFQWRLWDLF